MKKNIALVYFLIIISAISAQNFTIKDTLRGSNTQFRNFWNVKKYNVYIEPNYKEKCLKGKTEIIFEIENNQNKILQIDLQKPLEITKIELFTSNNENIKSKKIAKFKKPKSQNGMYFIDISKYNLQSKNEYLLQIDYKGNPIISQNPPWEGGWIFAIDKNKNPWMTVTCESNGASIWFPCKDYYGDEPDNGATLQIVTDENLVGVGNGKLLSKEKSSKNGMRKTYTWQVKNPINLYNIIPYIADYKYFSDNFEGKKGTLSLDYYVLSYNIEKAQKQFSQVKPMLKIFEDWFGAYPFYEDGYKLVESPHLGMEHQSAVAYGNNYQNGYRTTDLSGTGIGLKFDFIIIHESAHEWFGNNISVADVADLWIHEAFTSYAETIYVEEMFGKEAANQYVIGTRMNIRNDKNIIGKYNVHNEGSTDMYFKGANMIHTLRQLIENDSVFKNILRKMNEEFYHQTVTSKQIEDFWSRETKIDLTEFFNQYLRSTKVPLLLYYQENGKVFFKYENVVDKFDMPLLTENKTWIYPNANQWKSIEYNGVFDINSNFYIQTKVLNK